MKLKSLALQGLMVFHERQEIDFASLPEGLIAITGRNGEGKTTLMGAIFAALFRELPPREGSLYRYCSGRDAFIELRFAMAAREYTSHVLVDAVAETQSAYLVDEQIGLPLSNGKVKEFDKEIASLVGTPRLLLSSVFSTQNRKGSFALLSVSERKALFIEMLGLGNYPAMEAKAKGRLAERQLTHDALLRRHDLLQASANEAVRISEELVRLREKAAGTAIVIQQLEADRVMAVALLAELDAALVMQSQTVRRIEELETHRQALEVRMVETRSGLTAHRRSLETERAALDAALLSCVARSQKAQRELADARTVVARRQEIEDGISRRVTLNDTQRDLVAEFNGSVAAERQREARAMKQLSAGHALRECERTILHCETDAAELAEIPCHGKAPYDLCPKITRAIESRARIPELRETLRKLEREAAASIPVEVDPEVRTLDEIRADQDRTASIYNATDVFISLRGALVEAERKLVEIPLALAEIDQQRRDVVGRLEVIAEGVDSMESAYSTRLAEIEAEIAAAVRELVDARAEDAGAKQVERDAASFQFRQIEGELWRKRNDAVAADVLITSAEKVLAESLTAHSDLQLVKAEVVDVVQDLEEWRLLIKALGQDGIPALEIDAAGPGISGFTNDLLAACFSTRFAVDLRTQRESADGSRLIEDFDIRVIDTVRGREGTIDDLSGGQQVIVGEAVSIAFALYNKGEHRLETLMRDETTGALDYETAPLYVKMLRRAQAIGGFSQVLFITHNPDCSNLADARIRCADGKVLVEV